MHILCVCGAQQLAHGEYGNPLSFNKRVRGRVSGPTQSFRLLDRGLNIVLVAVLFLVISHKYQTTHKLHITVIRIFGYSRTKILYSPLQLPCSNQWASARSELVLLVRLRTLPVKVVEVRRAALVGPLAVAHPLYPRHELLDVGPRGLGQLDSRVEAGGVGVDEEHRGEGEGLGLAQLIGARLGGEYTGLTGRRQGRELASSARRPVGIQAPAPLPCGWSLPTVFCTWRLASSLATLSPPSLVYRRASASHSAASRFEREHHGA